MSDEKIELILLELRHREFLQIIHDLIYISLFIGAGLFISVIIPGAIRPSIMQLSPFYDVAVTVQFILAIYLAAGFFGFFMQFWLELARVEKYLKEIDNRREKTEKHLNTEDQSP